MKQQKSAGLVIYYLKNNQPYFLLLKYPTYWGFVKGLLEDGEDEKKAAVREAEEEANLRDLEISTGFKEKQTFFFKLHNELIRKEAVFFLAKTSEEESEKTKISWEHEDFAWLPLEEALKKAKIKDNKELLKKAEKFIGEYESQKKLV